MNVRETYDTVELPVSKRFKCRCGKRVTRKTTLWQTFNPFNLNSAGQVKTRDEIRRELLRDAEEWRRNMVLCRSCKEREAAR